MRRNRTEDRIHRYIADYLDLAGPAGFWWGSIENRQEGKAEPVAWMERAISRKTGQPVAKRHKTASERVVDEALGRASRAWAALFDEKRDFGWVQRVWPERAAALGLPGCAVTREAYAAHYAEAAA